MISRWRDPRNSYRWDGLCLPWGLYLGCRISKGEAVLHDKTRVQTVNDDMETYLDMTVKKYCDVTGFDPTKFKLYHHLVRRKRQRIILPGRRCAMAKVIDARGVETPCLLTRMVG